MSKLKKRRIWPRILIIVLIILLGLSLYSIYASYKVDKLSNMNFEEMLNYTTKDNEDALITIGIIQNDTMTYDVYGNNGLKLSRQDHIYEIGSITKTFTTSLLSKAISEDRISLNNSIDEYLELPKKDYYPTIRRLVTHTSGYKEFYFEKPMISNFIQGKNEFNWITPEILINRIGKIDLTDTDYPFKYSNFGMSVLGAVLEQVYNEDFTTLMNSYIIEELELKNTIISDPSVDLDNSWEWSHLDAYIPAGALLSNVIDMMTYVKIHMIDNPTYLSMGHEALAQVDATSGSYKKMGIGIDGVGLGWMIDGGNNIIWHNGATANYNSYVGFDKEKQIGVVVLSNLPPDYRVPSTIMGIKILTNLQSKK